MTAGRAAPIASGGPSAASSPEVVERWETHRTALLSRRRCPSCAEHRPARELLAGEPCPHCGSPNLSASLPAERRIALALGSVRKRRFIGYALVGAAAAIAGLVPLLATVTTVVAMILLRRAILRGASNWLSPKRRATTKLLLRQWLVIAALIMLVVDEVATVLPFPGWPIRIGSAVVAAAIYVEVALIILRDRIRQDQRSPDLQIWEWLAPVVAATVMVGAAAGAAALFVGAYEVIAMTFGWLGQLTGGGR
jgi:hypothetical protein